MGRVGWHSFWGPGWPTIISGCAIQKSRDTEMERERYIYKSGKEVKRGMWQNMRAVY